MGGMISRILLGEVGISSFAYQKMNAAQQAQYQREPSIKERFEFSPISQFSRAIFIAAPHQGTQHADRWFTKFASKIMRLPNDFYSSVEQH